MQDQDLFLCLDPVWTLQSYLPGWFVRVTVIIIVLNRAFQIGRCSRDPSDSGSRVVDLTFSLAVGIQSALVVGSVPRQAFAGEPFGFLTTSFRRACAEQVWADHDEKDSLVVLIGNPRVDHGAGFT